MVIGMDRMIVVSARTTLKKIMKMKVAMTVLLRGRLRHCTNVVVLLTRSTPVNRFAKLSVDGSLSSPVTVSTMEFLMVFTRSQISFNSVLMSNQ